MTIAVLGVRGAGGGGFPGGWLPVLETSEPWVQPLSGEEPLEEERAPHSRILAWRIPWTEEAGGLRSIASQRVGHD